MPPRDTGLPQTDAQFDFGRARRKRALSQIAARLRREGDLSAILPFEEVVRALGQRGEKRLGLQTIDLDSIVGTVDRGREFDRSFRPTSGRVRPRWERINTAQRKGQEMPPIDVYRIGELHFVKDGHHRVSVARALGFGVIDAYVTEIVTELGAGREIRLSDLALKSHQRLFFERVPLPADARTENQALRRVALRRARGSDRGVGLPREPGPGRAAEPLRGRRAVVRRGVPPSRRDAARSRADPGAE